MTTATRSSILDDLTNLDPCGGPFTEWPSRPAERGPLPGLRAKTVLASVQRVEPPRHDAPLVWGVAEGRTILFRVSDATIGELEAALAAGEEPTAIVEPCQIVSVDL